MSSNDSVTNNNVVWIGKDINTEQLNAVYELIQQALGSEAAGYPCRFERLPSNTANVVARAKVTLPSVLKIDESPKLVREARFLQQIQRDPRLPKRFKQRFPNVYAINPEPPYAYLMEEFSGYSSLADLLFESSLVEDALGPQGLFLLENTLGAMEEGYITTVDIRKTITPEDYLGRIKERLVKASKLMDIFAPHEMVVDNGGEVKSLKAWTYYLEALEADHSKLHSLFPPFLTFVHGDPNPENILVRYDRGSNGEIHADVRFIDPKDWGEGDYIFDLAKLAHYIHSTGPSRRLTADKVEFQRVGDTVEIFYPQIRAAWVDLLTDYIIGQVSVIGRKLGDTSPVDLRFQLAMAANILGLPVGCCRKERPHQAVVLYAEGLLLLDRFFQQFNRWDRP